MAATNFDTTRVRLGDLVAAASGLVLFIALFLNWYSASVNGPLGGSVSGGVSGWEVLSFIDILLFIIAIIAVGLAVARMANAFPRMAVSPGLLVLGVGVLATLLVLFRLLVLPGDLGDVNDLPGVDVGRSIGIFIALIAALGITAGGWITWTEEGKPKPGSVGGGTVAPVGAGQPYGGAPQPAGGSQQQQAAAPAASPAAGAAPAVDPGAAAAPAGDPGAAAGPGTGAPTGAVSAESADAPPPGGAADWYPDPRGEKRLRYWDGSQWTHHTAD
jgi:hypothetical protein